MVNHKFKYVFFEIAVVISAICISLIGISAIYPVKNDIVKDDTTKNTAAFIDTISTVYPFSEFTDSIPAEDITVLLSIVEPLKKREGLMLNKYALGNYWYIGYGHMVSYKDTIKYPITEVQADSILWSDIKKSYWNVQHLDKKKLYDYIYQIFTAGHVYKY